MRYPWLCLARNRPGIRECAQTQGLAVVLCEQNTRFATRVAGRAYIIEKGRIGYQGTMAELQGGETVRNAYLSV